MFILYISESGRRRRETGSIINHIGRRQHVTRSITAEYIVLVRTTGRVFSRSQRRWQNYKDTFPAVLFQLTVTVILTEKKQYQGSIACLCKCKFTIEAYGRLHYYSGVIRGGCTKGKWGRTTDLHIYNLDAVPPIHVVSNHVDTDKLTTANGGTFTSSSASPVANHVKARQSPIERAVT